MANDETPAGPPTEVDEAAELIGSVSHELRTPLHAMLGFAELLSTSELDEDQRDFADSILREGRVLERMISELLDFSRVEAGRVDLIERPYSPVNLANEVVNLLQDDARKRNLTLRTLTTLERTDLSRGDDRRVRQILVNLVSNAIKFTPFGSVTIASEADERTGTLLFEVRDTGIGIPPEKVEALFAPFRQVHSVDQGRGSGLGLAICRRLAELMGGAVDVESQVGVGSTFRVTLPLRAARRSGDVRHVEKLAHPARPSRVLVVDDSQLNLTLARGQLERLGHTVETAPDGETALETLESETFDLILMDWRMPGLDGLETTRRYRATEQHPAPVPIIAMTANARAGDHAQCLDAGMNDVLTKPVSIETLSSTLSVWLDHDPGEPATPPADCNIDRRAISNLAEELGDPEVVRAVIATFLEELPQRRQTIRAASTGHCDETVRRAAHSLKSASKLVGASRLAKLCKRLEALEEDSSDLRSLAASIDEEADRVEHSVSAIATEL